MLNSLLTLIRDEDGQGLAEYAMILVLVAVAAAAVFPNLAGAVNGGLGAATAAV